MINLFMAENNARRRRGVTLIMVAAVLAILAALSTGFYTMMLMQTKAATRYSDSIRADMMSRAGIEYAIGRLHDQCFLKTEDPTDPWFMVDYLHGARRRHSYPADLSNNGIDDDNDKIIDNAAEKEMGFSVALSNTAEINSDRFTLNIFDSSSRININACDNLGVLLDNLCRVIGPPLVAADQDFTVPRIFEWYGGPKFNTDVNDWPKGGTPGGLYTSVPRDIYYANYDTGNVLVPLFTAADALIPGVGGRPRLNPKDGKTALFGDGYAIAGYRARMGKFKSLDEVKNALTYVERSSPPNTLADEAMEQLEIEVKFAAIRDYITVNSWVDTTSICTGKFEWVQQSGASGGSPYDLAIDRDKSWVPDDPVNDPENKRGSLRGSYVAIVNGHGAGQLRRIRTNGIDWIKIETFFDDKANAVGFVIPPGPTSSYMIMAAEDALLADINNTKVAYSYSGTSQKPPSLPPNPLAAGTPGIFPHTVTLAGVQSLDDDPNIDYSTKPLCIHRAPININTASDKVLAAMFMGINVTHGHFLSIGTDADMSLLAKYNPVTGKYKPRETWVSSDPDWKITDYVNRTVEPYVLTPKGLKRIPATAGKLVWNVDFDTLIKAKIPATYSVDYLNNYGTSDPLGTTKVNEAHEIAYRIMMARQREPDPNNAGAFLIDYIDPLTGAPTATVNKSYQRGAFRSWDDLYFRVVKPWDDARVLRSIDGAGVEHKASVARMIMAHFNPNTDILKFNPNIEWIDRWGRNFTAMEPVMVYTNLPENNDGGSSGHGDFWTDPNWNAAVKNPSTTCDMDQNMSADAIPFFDRERLGWGGGSGPFYVFGPFNTLPVNNGSYVTRSYRYKSDEMIDKTDLNRSTTEFSFDSRGIYEIQSSGQVVKRGDLLAERKIQTLVKIYDVWTESTQSQFVNGYISRAAGNAGTAQAGSIARDYNNISDRLALTTLPEPLVPLAYTIDNPKNIEVVDTTIPAVTQKRNAWKQAVDMKVPDVVANKILPASYDGQIVLATNTLRYDPTDAGDQDTFLASFNGDLDTETCKGNGHEQAKTPVNCQVRVIDTVGLLGALNDYEIDTDPGARGDTAWETAGSFVTPDLAPYGAANPLPAAQGPVRIFRFKSAIQALRGLDPRFYWNNCASRQGKLRSDGAFVGGAGISGNDGVMKYLCGPDDPANYENQNYSLNGKGATRQVGPGVGGSSGNVQGSLISMWAKTVWHHNDGRNHDFFDCTTPGWAGGGIRAEAWYLRKQGRVQCAVSEGGSGTSAAGDYISEDPTWGTSGAGDRGNTFSVVLEPQQNAGDMGDPDWNIYMHGGTSGGAPNGLPKDNESPAYRIQPFRWHFLGSRIFLQPNFANCHNGVSGLGWPTDFGGAGKSGFWKPNQNPSGVDDNNSIWVASNLFRPFIDSERFPEGPTYQPKTKFWVCVQPQGATGFTPYQSVGRAGPLADYANGGQSVRWSWAHPGGLATADGKKITDNTVFGMNNCNPGQGYQGTGTDSSNFGAIYKNSPDEGTYSVIDEFKISRKETLLRTTPEPASDRITRDDTNAPGEMTLSRYYLPQRPEAPLECPTFTSQSMLQSLKGFDKIKIPAAQVEKITLARVTWTCFTPRFMHQYKLPGGTAGTFKRDEKITKNGTLLAPNGATLGQSIAYRGPFDYCKYNDILVSFANGEDLRFLLDDVSFDKDGTVVPYRCRRPTPSMYQDPTQLNPPLPLATDYADVSYQATKGVEVEVLDDPDDDPKNSNAVVIGKYTNPDSPNAIGSSAAPVVVQTDHLRYRVRFRFPVDQLADPGGGNLRTGSHHVDPATMYLLDTPVFDDISITYFRKPRILDYKEILE